VSIIVLKNNEEMLITNITKTEYDRNFLKFHNNAPKVISEILRSNNCRILFEGRQIKGKFGSQNRLYFNKNNFMLKNIENKIPLILNLKCS